MTRLVLNFINEIGIIGLFIVMAIEGLSIPFPSILVIPTYGYLLNPSLSGMIIISFVMSLVYCAFSFIPYAIVSKIETKIKGIFRRKIQKAQNWFQKYGVWSITVTRLLGIGYISVVAGMSKINPWKYGSLTLLGIFPWSFGMLFIGQMYKGNAKMILQLIQEYREYVLLGFLIIVLSFSSISLLRYSLRKG